MAVKLVMISAECVLWQVLTPGKSPQALVEQETRPAPPPPALGPDVVFVPTCLAMNNHSAQRKLNSLLRNLH